MKARRLIEALKQVSPDTEVMCGVTVKDTPTLFTINLFDLERTQKYEVKSVLTKPNNDKYCTLLIKRNQKGVKNMVTPIEDQLRGELRVLKECHNQVCQQLVEEQEKNEKLEGNYYKILEDLMQKLRAINNLLNDLYEIIDRKYTTLENSNEELTIARADAQLQLIEEIIDKVDRI